MRFRSTSIIVLAILFALVAHAEPVRTEAESKRAHRHEAVKVVEDPNASGGKAIEVPAEGVPHWNVVAIPFPDDFTPGRYRVRLRMQADALYTFGKALRIDIEQGGKNRDYGVAYGWHLGAGDGYRDFVIECEHLTLGVRPTARMRWVGKEGKPTVRLDYIEFERVAELPPLYIKTLWPDKLRYGSRDSASVKVVVANRSADDRACSLRVDVTHNLGPARLVDEQTLSIPAGDEVELKLPLRLSGDFGYGLRAVLSANGAAVDEAEEVFCVGDNPWQIAVAGNRDEQMPGYYTIWGHSFYGIGTTERQIVEGALHARREYTTCTEFFSWSPGECFDMAPDEATWVRGNGGDIVRSKREIQRQVRELKSHGIACISYIAYQAMGEKSIEILAEKPEWFTYSSDTGDLLEWYDVGAITRHRNFPSVYHGDPRTLKTMGYFVPNYMLPEVVDFCADEVIASAKMFGWDGLRWDCGHLNPGPIWGEFKPFVDFQGKPQARSMEELDESTAKNLKRLRRRIRRAIPGFVIGTNYGSVSETPRFPKQVAEVCRDGGWLLDEVSYNYNEKSSPYHWWRKYYEVMADQGEFVTSLGGHYNPYTFNRNGGKYTVDRVYGAICALAGKGHPNIMFHNSRSPFGNFSQFAVRFGEFLFNPKLRRLKNPKTDIAVTAPAPVWWDRTVQSLAGKADFKVIHLINPPVSEEVEGDPGSALPAPVEDTQVSARIPAKKRQVKAWALAAESWRTGEPPQTQAVPLKVSEDNGWATATVPELLCWKVVVFRFAK